MNSHNEESAPPVANDARRVALIVASAFFMQNLDGAIINTSLPQMAHSFSVDPVDLNIGITAYVLATAAFIPSSGWVASRWGARPVFAWAIAIFSLSSLAAGLSLNLWQFVTARVIQGIGGALMVPVGQMVVLSRASKANLLAVITTIAWPALTAPVIGPALGGFITTYASWRWNFLINLPFGAAGIALVVAFIPPLPEQQRSRFDFLGFVLSATALIALLWGLGDLASGRHWVRASAVIASGGALGFLSFRHLTSHDQPLLSLQALKVPTYFIAVFAGGCAFRIAAQSTPFLLPLMFQLEFGLSAWTAGLYSLAYFAGNLMMKTVTGPSYRRFGFRTVMFVNAVLAGVAIVACGFLGATTPFLVIIATLLFAGFTRSMQFTGLNTLAFADISAEHRNSSSTLSSMFNQIAQGMGVAIAASLLTIFQTVQGKDQLSITDFRLTFIVMGLLAITSSLLFLSLKPDAGAEVSGHRRPVRQV